MKRPWTVVKIGVGGARALEELRIRSRLGLFSAHINANIRANR